jgi:hypothetical protein
MKVAVVILAVERSGPSGGPQVHSDGCADVARGLASGKYRSAEPIDVEVLEDAARWFWRDFLRTGEMTETGAQASTRYMPCVSGPGRRMPGGRQGAVR